MLSRYFFRHTLRLLFSRPIGKMLVLLACVLAVFQLALTAYFFDTVQRVRLMPISAQVVMTYLKGSPSESQQQQIKKAIIHIDGVAGLTFVPRASGLERLKTWLGPENPLVSELDSKILPDAFEVRIHESSLKQTEQIAQTIKLIPGVEDVRYNKGIITQIAAAIPRLQLAGLVVALLATLSLGIIFFQSNQLALQAHIQEMEILKTLGASLGFLHAPYITVSLIISMLAALIGCLAAHTVVFFLRLQFVFLIDYLNPFSLMHAAVVTVFSVCFSIAGAMAAMRK